MDHELLGGHRFGRTASAGLDPAPRVPAPRTHEGGLLTAKLARPHVPAASVPRARAAALLEAGTAGPLTVVSAGAGWGKTLATAAWADTDPAVGPVAWLSLDERDNEPRSFWGHVLGALRGALALPPGHPLSGLDPALGREHENHRRLVAGIAELPTPVVLVLDDFHLIQEAAVRDGVAALLQHPLPQLRLVLLCRADPALPLNRLRVSRELTEVRSSDLAFDPAETAALLAADGVPVAPAQVELLVRRTEGWPAGLRLAALFLSAGDPERTAAQFAGDDRAVSDYLLEEVLASQPVELQRFLMHTSVAERLSGGLASVLSGEPRGQQILEDLERSNAFVVALGPDRRWFRYHPLLREMLRHQLDLVEPSSVAELHRRAAGWLAGIGRPVEALRHAMEAADWALFGDLFVNRAAPLLVSTDRAALGRVIESVPPQCFGETAEMALCGAGLELYRGQLVAMPSHLALAASLLTADPRSDSELGGAHIALQLLTTAAARASGDVPALVAAASAALDLLDGPGLGVTAAPAYRAVALGNLGAGLLWSGRLDEAERMLRDSLVALEGTGLEASRINALGHLALVLASTNRLRDGFGLASTAVDLVAARGWAPLPQAAVAYLALATIHVQWNNLDQARALVELGRADVGDVVPQFALSVARARLEASTGDVDAALDELDWLRQELGHWRPPPFLSDWLTVASAEVDLAAGDPDAALARLRPAEADDQVPANERLCLVRALLAVGDPRAAEDVLAALRSRLGPGRTLVEAWVLTALAADRLREDNRALEALDRALDLARPEGVRRPFVHLGGEQLGRLLARYAQVSENADGFVTELVADLGVPGPASPDNSLLEPLTDRELSVLRHLPTMMTNGEIAAELYVSVNTVKAHLKRIYRKLGVVSRRDAVHRARELGLLEH